MRHTAVRATLAIAAVYGFFLIFAQYSFVELLRAGGAGLTLERTALGIMAAAGIAGGFFAAARGVTPRMLRIAMGVAAGAAALAPVSGAMAAALLIAAATGAALGVATVGLAALLPAWCGVAWVGLGTGLGYAAFFIIQHTAELKSATWGNGLTSIHKSRRCRKANKERRTPDPPCP